MTWETANRILGSVWLFVVLAGLLDFFRTIHKYGKMLPTGFKAISFQSLLYTVNWLTAISVSLAYKPFKDWNIVFARSWWVITVIWAVFIFIRWILYRRCNIDPVYAGVEAQLYAPARENSVIVTKERNSEIEP